MAELQGKLPKPGAPRVGPRKAKPKGSDKIVEGAGGKVTANSIGQASSVAGSQPYGRPITRMVYAMQPAGDLAYGGSPQRAKIQWERTNGEP